MPDTTNCIEYIYIYILYICNRKKREEGIEIVFRSDAETEMRTLIEDCKNSLFIPKV